MKCHDWIFLIFTTIICCTTTISIAQAQQRGRVKFALSPQKDETDPIPSPESAPRPNRVRTSVPRASTRFRSSEQSSTSSPVLESKETPRTPVLRSRNRSSNRSSQKLDTEATELVPSIRSRKRGNSVSANDQPTRVQLPTANVERTNVERTNVERTNVERPNVDRPNVDRLNVDRLNVDRLNVVRSNIDRPSADRSNIDRPSVDRSSVDRPSVDRSSVDRPSADRSSIDRPSVDRPSIDRSSVDRPNVDRPITDRANIIRQSKSRPETVSSTTSASSSPTTPHFRRRSDGPIEESSENVRKVRTFSRSVTRRSDSVVPSPEGPLITTARNDWRTAGKRRGSAKPKTSGRKSKSLDDEEEDQLEDENYPEHFKILLKKQKPKTHLPLKSLPRPLLPEDPTFARSNEIYDSTKSPFRPRRLEQPSQESSDEILQVPRAIPKVRRVELKREDTARAALKSRRVEPSNEELSLQTKNEDIPKVPSKSRRIDPSVSQLLNEDIPRVSFKSRRVEPPSENVSRSSFKSRRNEPLREPPTETKQNEPPKALFKSRRIEAQPEEIKTEVKPNEIIEPAVKLMKPLFIPRRAEPYRPKPTSSTPRSTTAAKSSRKPETQDSRAKYKARISNRLQFPSLRSKTTPTPPENPIKDDNEIANVRPNPQPIRPPQITKSRNLAFDRPKVDTKSKSKTQKFSSRYRGDAFSRYQQKSDTSKPIYTPTIPAVTTEPIKLQSDLPSSRTGKSSKPYNPESHDLIQSDNKYAGVVFDEIAGVWNMVEPIADGLTRSEISVDSADDHSAQPSVTVSIFEALADILSKTPTTTTTTTTTTTSTTTSTTELPEIIQVPEIKVDSMQISSTTVNTHLITDVDDEYTTTTNEITNFDRNGRVLNRVDINQNPSTLTINPSTTSTDPNESSQETTTLTVTTQNTDTSTNTELNTESETEPEVDQTTLPDYTDLTTLALAPAPTQPTYSNTNTNTELTNSNTSILELTTFSSIPPTNLPMPHLADALTTPGSSLVTQPQLISAISNFLDTSVQNASETMATSTTTADTTTTLETNTNTESISTSDASQTLSPTTRTITTNSSLSTESPPVTISFLDLFTIQPKKVNSNTEPAIDIHPIYREPDPTTTPADKKQKILSPESTTGQPVNIQTFFRTQTYPSITITGGTSTDRIRELSSTFLIPSSEDTVTDGIPTETLIPSTTTHDQDTSVSTTSLDYTTLPQSTQTQSSLPIHLNSVLGSTQIYDQTSPTKTTEQSETTTTIRSRFGNNRLPILPAGSGWFNTKPTTSTSTTSTTTTTTTSKTISTSTTTGSSSSTSPSVTPPLVTVLPKQRQLSNSTSLSTQQQQEPNVIQDFSVYGILPNNTVVRKRPPEVSRTLDVGVMVYGILANQTVVRKYPNGTLAIVDSSKDVEVVDIDPKMLFNPFSELYRTSQSSLLLTTHRSTTSHRLIESNDIVSSVPRSSSSTSIPIPISTIGTRRTGISIKESMDSVNPDATTTNGADDNLIQLLNENEDNLLNSTSLVEPNTENAVLLDLLKRKYINSDLPSRSSNVVSFTTVRNMIEESSIQANKEEDVSENTLLDSSEEKMKDISTSTSSEEDLLGKLFPSNSPTESNTDDDNIISHHFDNVERGSIFEGNKEPKKVDNKQTPTIYLVTPGTTIPTTTPSSTSTTTSTTTTPSTTTSTTSTTPSTTTTTTPSTTTPTTTPSTTTSTTTPTEPPPTTTSTTTTTEPPTTTTTTTTTSTTTTTTPMPTTISTTPLTTSTLPSTTVSQQPNLAVNELEKNIKLLQQLLALQVSSKRKSTTSTSNSTTSTSSTTTTSSTTPSTSSSTTQATTKSPALTDDAFLNTLRQLLLAQQRTTKKPTTSTTTTSTTTTTTTPKPTTTTTLRTPVTISPQNLQDLLNSFSTPSFSTTTSKDDIDFLNSLRDIGKLKVTTSVPPTFANRIIELALQNRQVTPTAPVYIPARVSSTAPPFTPLPEIRRPTILPSNDIENHRQDQASLSADLTLLSTLLGRRITVGDLPQLTQQFGGNRRPVAPSVRPTPRTTTTTTTSTSTEKPMTRNEIAEIEKNLNLLSTLLGRPVSLNELPLIMRDLRSGRKPKGTPPGARINLISPIAMKTTTTNHPRTTLSVQSQTPISQEEVIELLKDPSFGTSPEQLNIYGNSNDAVLAAVLKQRGIGPTHNNIPVNDLFLQGPTPTPYRTTRPPPPPPTQPQRRPLLDGLAWLWRAWQDTSPGTRTSRNRQPEAAASTRLESPILIANTAGSGEGGEYADLQYPKNPTNPSLGQGNGLLTAAFGVTRAVTQFLGAAFQGAAQSVQSAFSPQALRQNNLMSLSG